MKSSFCEAAMIDKSTLASYFQHAQNQICQALCIADGQGTFRKDTWQRAEGGGGKSHIMENGEIIERGGVNFSEVFGKTPEKILKKLNITDASDFYATGLSIVMHPHSPMVPIIHMNVRYFAMNNGLCWFGGGIDLTPHYIDLADARYFHQQLKQVCYQHHPDYYAQFKSWADDYFFLKHRNETRGIGGIFFDRLSATPAIDMAQRFAFVKDVTQVVVPIYTHFMHKNHALPYGESEKNWQLLRRGRYVEFNLIWDVGTRFGLDTNGRTASIFMSMPPMAKWVYDDAPNDVKAQATLKLLKKNIDWVNS